MFKIGDFELKARLLLGTGKFDNEAIQTQAIETSETEVLTFAVRRMNLYDKALPNPLAKVDLSKRPAQKQQRKQFILLKLPITPVSVT